MEKKPGFSREKEKEDGQEGPQSTSKFVMEVLSFRSPSLVSTVREAVAELVMLSYLPLRVVFVIFPASFFASPPLSLLHSLLGEMEGSKREWRQRVLG